MEDWKVDGRVAVDTTVDKIESMKGKGQYIYVSVVDGTEGAEAVEPIVKFNNGHEGGSSDQLFNEQYRKDSKGILHAVYKDKIDPALRKQLGEPASTAPEVGEPEQ
eukprot:TRINITY_DN50954_c0_g1_i1.p1 TRINITY_DN50954_c0_g1~~TRINITY_DN50954_c0_g1_i1.p1  ORF type:complete len:106 (+),score=27.18 TRINITY_DN50954_c0_g1_i1:130-447(+)